MEDGVDVKALRARFNAAASSASDASSRDSGSPKSPRPGLGRAPLPAMENSSPLHHRLSPVTPAPGIGPGPLRFPRAAEPTPSPAPGVRALPPDQRRVKQKGEFLQGMMLRHQRPPGAPVLPPCPAEGPAPGSAPPVPRQLPRQKRAGEVVPLRRPLPPEGPLPLKPKRPPSVNLAPYTRAKRGPAPPAALNNNQGRKMSFPAPGPMPPPQRANKPGRLPHQFASLDIVEDEQETYDDIGSFEKNESWSDHSSHCMDGDDDETYEFIDGEQPAVKQVDVAANKKEAKKQREREKREQTERQKKENDLRKKFQLQGPTEVLHTAKVRHDWRGGGKLDLSVRQGDSVDILRVKNNPGGKWLARSQTGSYGYISNACVDIDYEAVKRKVLQSKKMDVSPLPPPPPDPPLMESGSRDSFAQDEDDYDDVQPISDDFPPPPPEISLDPKTEKELKKRFKYEGPIRVLHTVLVNPNSIIKKPGGRDLRVSHGDILDVVQITNNKKALCRDAFGKFGYVSRSLLLPMEGDIYDDVDYPSDVYDNDSPH